MTIIKKWLGYKGWNQTDLAKKMNVSSAFISEYCNEQKRMSLETRAKFAKAFGVSVEEFMSGPIDIGLNRIVNNSE